MPVSDLDPIIDRMIAEAITTDGLEPGAEVHLRKAIGTHLADLLAARGPEVLPGRCAGEENERRALIALTADAVYRHGLSDWVTADQLRPLASRWRPAALEPEAFGSLDQVRAACRPLCRVDDSYDVVIVGSGAGGGTAAREFAEAGWRVLLVERGGFPAAQELLADHARSPRAASGLHSFGGPDAQSEYRTVPSGADVHRVQANDPRWGNNAMTLGGGTRLYGAQAWRFTAEDLAMASTYGVPDGSALADWPITLSDLAPYYEQIESELGLAGPARDPDGGPAPWRLAPLSGSKIGARLVAAAQDLGWTSTPVPLLINSRAHAGRPACIRCSQCVGFECPVNARAGTHNTMLPRAAATGNLTIVLGAQATRVLLDPRGRRARAVHLSDGAGTERSIGAAAVVLAAGAIETARLLLDSTHPEAAQGLGNATDNVGRYLQGHLYGGASALFDDPVVDLVGPGPEVAVVHTRHHNHGYVGGGMLANEFVPTPANTVKYLLDTGLVPASERIASVTMESAMLRFGRVMGPVQEVTTAGARVRLDRTRTDAFGRSTVRLSGSPHQEDYRVQRFLAHTAAQWLEAAGAGPVVPMHAGAAPNQAPSAGQHQAGTARMGTEPSTSVTDPMGRLWDCPNVLVVDGSTHVTNGGVNPVLTILANSTRISRAYARTATQGS